MYFQSKKNEQRPQNNSYIYFKILQEEKALNLIMRKKNKLQNNLLCLKSFMYLHGELKYSLSHTDTCTYLCLDKIFFYLILATSI